MAMLRSRRLEALFDGELDAVTPEKIRSLIDGQVEEAFDLDFKGQLYGGSDKEKRDLCSDVAALANTAGGLVVLGVVEDEQSRAADAPGVDVSDAEVGRIRQIVASGVSPLPLFDVVKVLDATTPSHGFLLIEVPRSVLAPHAVLVGESLRFPTRNGATTRHLSEPEVAVAYRTRLAGEAERTGRLARIEADMLQRLDLTEDPWLIVSLVPDLPGDLTITRETFSDFQQEVQRRRFLVLDGGGTNFPHADVGHNRLRADDVFRDDHPQPHYRAIEIHTDGSGTAAVRLYDIGTPVRALASQDSSLCTVSDEAVAAALISALQWLASNAADRAHASGMAALRASLFVAANVPQTALGSIRSGFVTTIGHTVDVHPEPVETFAPLDELVASGRGLVEAAARLHHGLGHAFGEPELSQLTLDGRMAWPFWNRDRRPFVAAWADDNGIEIIGRPGTR